MASDIDRLSPNAEPNPDALEGAEVEEKGGTIADQSPAGAEFPSGDESMGEESIEDNAGMERKDEGENNTIHSPLGGTGEGRSSNGSEEGSEEPSKSKKRPLDEESEESDSCDGEKTKAAEGSDKYHCLAKLLTMMEDYRPVIPDAVTDYYLAKSGFECDDVRVKRLLALATQRFISNVAEGAMHYYLMHSKGSESKDKKGLMKSKIKVLEMDDLSLSLTDHGINVKKQEYYL